MRIRELQKHIDRQSYTSDGTGNAEKVTTRLAKYYAELEELRMPKTEANKLWQLRGRINMGGALQEPYYISVWQGHVDAEILEHMSEGTEIDYAQWTTRLVNDEANFKKNSHNDSARISSASSGDSPSAQWLDSGKPTGPSIHNTDITVLYGNVSKLEVKPWISLPRKIRQWFIDNPDLQCPTEFLCNNAPHNKNKNSTRNVSFAEACDDFSGGEYETDTEPSSAEDDESAMSSDGSGDITNH